MTSLEVDYSSYSRAKGKDIQLYYKAGYFGLLYFDGYSLVDRTDDIGTEVPIDDFETVEN